MPDKQRTCPKCAAKVGPWDTVCIDCGAPVPLDREPVQIADDRDYTPLYGGASANPAAGGLLHPGESSEKTRMRVFDKHMAEELKKERPATLVLAAIGLIAAVALTFAAKGLFTPAGGWVGLKDADWTAIRQSSFGMFVDARVLFIIATGLCIAAYLCGIGELLRFVAQTRAIRAVERNELPDVVGVTILTRVGLLIAAFLLPPLGIIMGLLLKMSNSNDLKDLGGQMLKLGVIAAGLVVLNAVWLAAAGFASQHTPDPKTP